MPTTLKAMQVVRLDGMYAKLPIESLQELGKVQVARLDVADVLRSQSLHNAVLQRAIDTLHAPLGLTGVGAQDLNVQLCECTTKLSHALIFRSFAVHPKH